MPALLALALALRAAWWTGYVGIVENEGVEYTRLAWNWFHGQGYVSVFGGTHTLFPPFYPFLIGVAAPVAGSEETAARVVSLLAGVALVAVVHGLAREVFDRRVAAIAGVLAAVHPALVALSVSTFSESLYIALGTGATYAAVSCLRRPSWGRAVATGGLAGLAYLTRPEGLAIAAGLGGLLLLSGVLRQHPWRQGLRHGGLALGTAVLVAAPYAVHLSRIAGGFRWEGKSVVNNLITERQRQGHGYQEAGRGLGPEAEPVGPFLLPDQHALLARGGDGGEGLLHTLATTPPTRIRDMAARIAGARFLGEPLILVLALVGFGCTAWWRRRPLEGAALLGLPAVACLSILTLMFTRDRYLLALLPGGLVWAAAGADALGRATARLVARHRPLGTAAALTGPAVSGALTLGVPAIAATSVGQVPEFAETRQGGVREAAGWIRHDFAAAADTGRPLIAGIGLAIAHYADGEIAYLPAADEARTLRHLRRVDPDYVVLRFEEAHRMPYARSWLRRGPVGTCTTPVEGLPPGASAHLRIWRWTCDPEAPPAAP